jgi:hypothetical protein
MSWCGVGSLLGNRTGQKQVDREPRAVPDDVVEDIPHQRHPSTQLHTEHPFKTRLQDTDKLTDHRDGVPAAQGRSEITCR